MKKLVTVRAIQIGLGLIWLLDGLLQLQRFMFTSGFASTILAPSGHGQPSFVAVPVAWAVRLILHAPALWNTIFALIQLAIGVGLLWRKSVRPAIIVSVIWGLAVWLFGEGLAGLASGTGSLLTGAPGAALLYAVLGLAVLPSRRNDPAENAPASWFPLAWAALWIGGAILSLLPAQRSSQAITDSIMNQAMAAPSRLMNFDASLNTHIVSAGIWLVITLVIVQLAIGISGLFRATRSWSAYAGIVAALMIWAIGESFGLLFTGSATDPNTGPLIVLFALALLISSERR